MGLRKERSHKTDPKRTSATILVGLAAIFVFCRVLLSIIPTQLALGQQQAYLSWFLVGAVLILGFVGWRLSLRIGIPEIWAGPNPARSRIIYPALLGLLIGIFWVLTDLFLQREVHASFPGVIPLYTYAAILSEVISRLFLATFIV